MKFSPVAIIALAAGVQAGAFKQHEPAAHHGKGAAKAVGTGIAPIGTGVPGHNSTVTVTSTSIHCPGGVCHSSTIPVVVPTSTPSGGAGGAGGIGGGSGSGSGSGSGASPSSSSGSGSGSGVGSGVGSGSGSGSGSGVGSGSGSGVGSGSGSGSSSGSGSGSSSGSGASPSSSGYVPSNPGAKVTVPMAGAALGSVAYGALFLL